ncbi:MAG: hypothetical protein AAGJ83_15150 [Planctomycetota bacterium]
MHLRSKARLLSLPLVAVTVFLIAMGDLVVAAPQPPADDRAAQAKIGRWMMSFHEDPSPDQVVENVRQMSRLGLLDPQPRLTVEQTSTVMFLGKVMENHADQIVGWMDEWSALPDGHREVLRNAVWFSQTPAGAEWLAKNNAETLANSKPAILDTSRALDLKPFHLDQYWAWFFATGDSEPVERVIAVYRLAHVDPKPDSLELLPRPERPAGDAEDSGDGGLSPEQLYRLQLLNYGVAGSAIWSASSIATSSDRLFEVLKKLESESAERDDRGTKWLRQVIRIAESRRKKAM